MLSTANDVEPLLDRAVELLTEPTLDNLRSVEGLFRQAAAKMPPLPSAVITSKVRLCGRLLEGAEAGRPGTESMTLYTAGGEPCRARISRLTMEA